MRPSIVFERLVWWSYMWLNEGVIRVLCILYFLLFIFICPSCWDSADLSSLCLRLSNPSSTHHHVRLVGIILSWNRSGYR